jgi:Holliday junction resolvase
MPNRSYRIGYAFERRVKQYYEQQGYFVIRQGKSKFPDLIVWKKPEEPFQFTKVIGIECKCNKYLSKEEKVLAKQYLNEGKFAEMWVAYRKKRKLLFYQINR